MKLEMIKSLKDDSDTVEITIDDLQTLMTVDDVSDDNVLDLIDELTSLAEHISPENYNSLLSYADDHQLLHKHGFINNDSSITPTVAIEGFIIKLNAFLSDYAAMIDLLLKPATALRNKILKLDKVVDVAYKVYSGQLADKTVDQDKYKNKVYEFYMRYQAIDDPINDLAAYSKLIAQKIPVFKSIEDIDKFYHKFNSQTCVINLNIKLGEINSATKSKYNQTKNFKATFKEAGYPNSTSKFNDDYRKRVEKVKNMFKAIKSPYDPLFDGLKDLKAHSKDMDIKLIIRHLKLYKHMSDILTVFVGRAAQFQQHMPDAAIRFNRICSKPKK